MRSLVSSSLSLLLLLPCACADRGLLGVDGGTGDETGDGSTGESATDTASSSASGDGDGDGETTTTASGDGDGDDTTTTTASTGDGDGDPASGDGDGDSTGDGDGDGTGDGDGDMSGDGDGDTTGDGDGDMSGDGDGDTTGDGDGDMTGDGDGDMTGDGDGDNGFVDVDGEYSITSTEITVDEYAAFLADNPGLDILPPTCSWKNDYTPDSWNGQLGEPTLPVVRVDWCDAYAYCEWAGYHLCGQVGGGPIPLADHDDPVDNEWFRACSNGDMLLYPYGNGYDGGACNGEDAGLDELVPVASLMTCEGGIANLFDMSGNAWEWTNSCADSPNTPDEDEDCRRRGGSYFSTANVLRCAVDSTRARNYRAGNTGLRCCL